MESEASSSLSIGSISAPVSLAWFAERRFGASSWLVEALTIVPTASTDVFAEKIHNRDTFIWIPE